MKAVPENRSEPGLKRPAEVLTGLRTVQRLLHARRSFAYAGTAHSLRSRGTAARNIYLLKGQYLVGQLRFTDISEIVSACSTSTMHFLLLPSFLFLITLRRACAEEGTTVQLTFTRRLETTVYPDYTPTETPTDEPISTESRFSDGQAAHLATTDVSGLDENAASTTRVQITLTRQLTSTVAATTTADRANPEVPDSFTVQPENQMPSAAASPDYEPEPTEPIIAYFGGEALTVGGDAKTISGDVVSLASSAIIVGSDTIPVPGTGATSDAEPTVDSQHSSDIGDAAAMSSSSLYPGPSEVAIGTATMTAGGVLSIEGGILSLGSAGDIVVVPTGQESGSLPAVVTGKSASTTGSTAVSQASVSGSTSEEVVSVVKLPPITAMLTNTSTIQTRTSTSMPWWASSAQASSLSTSTTTTSGAVRSSSSLVLNFMSWALSGLRVVVAWASTTCTW